MSQPQLSPTRALPAACPVILEARRALSASRNLTGVLRRLQRSRRKCRSCPLAARRLRAACAPYPWHEARGAARRLRAVCAPYPWHEARGAASGLPGTDCPAWQEFNRLVEQAITEINREWDML